MLYYLKELAFSSKTSRVDDSFTIVFPKISTLLTALTISSSSSSLLFFPTPLYSRCLVDVVYLESRTDGGAVSGSLQTSRSIQQIQHLLVNVVWLKAREKGKKKMSRVMKKAKLIVKWVPID